MELGHFDMCRAPGWHVNEEGTVKPHIPILGGKIQVLVGTASIFSIFNPNDFEATENWGAEDTGLVSAFSRKKR